MIKPEDYPIVDRIKGLRESRALSQAKFANLIGVSSGNVGQWERYITLPGALALLSIAQKLECSVDWILTGDEPKSCAKKIEVIPDPELKRMIDILTEIMNDPDPRRRNWATIQFEDAFRLYCTLYDEKKIQA